MPASMRCASLHVLSARCSIMVVMQVDDVGLWFTVNVEVPPEALFLYRHATYLQRRIPPAVFQLLNCQQQNENGQVCGVHVAGLLL